MHSVTEDFQANRQMALLAAREMGVRCGACASPMTAERVLAVILRPQWDGVAPHAVVLFRCGSTLECGTEAHVEVDCAYDG